MTSNQNHMLLSFDDADDYGRLSDALQTANYTDEGVRRALDCENLLALGDRDVPAMLRHTRGDGPLETLIRLFWIGVSVDRRTAGLALEPASVDACCKAGLLEARDSQVFSAVKLVPHKDLLLAVDMPRKRKSGSPEDFVMTLGGSTVALGNMTVRRPCGDALDLGTGCGVHAFWAAAHCRHVTAVDCNPHAIHLATFNARLNAMENVEFLTGDLFEPVRDRRFDLVVMNPPFVISPVQRFVFRDAGMRADRFCRRLAAAVPEYLREGGYFQMICNWAHYTGRDHRESLAEWFEGTGCDTWVLHSGDQDLSKYATTWILGIETDLPEEFLDRYNTWLDYFRDEGIEAIAEGVITMRRTSRRPNWFHVEEAPAKMLGPCGEHVVQAFETHDFLNAHTDDASLATQRVAISPHLRLDHECEANDGQWSIVASQLRLSEGMAHNGNVDLYVSQLVVACDGRRTLAEVIDRMAASTDRPQGEIAPAVLQVVRQLLQNGFVVPV